MRALRTRPKVSWKQQAKKLQEVAEDLRRRLAVALQEVDDLKAQQDEHDEPDDCLTPLSGCGDEDDD